jgi:hypothetical protein
MRIKNGVEQREFQIQSIFYAARTLITTIFCARLEPKTIFRKPYGYLFIASPYTMFIYHQHMAFRYAAKAERYMRQGLFWLREKHGRAQSRRARRNSAGVAAIPLARPGFSRDPSSARPRRIPARGRSALRTRERELPSTTRNRWSPGSRAFRGRRGRLRPATRPRAGRRCAADWG